MPRSPSPSFSHLVCGADWVQNALTLHRPTRFWWRLILKLHGKPTPPSLSNEDGARQIADGFKFYAWLYRLLSVLFLLLCLPLVALNGVESGTVSPYWVGTILLAGSYLWCVSGLGFAGARAYRSNPELGRVPLLAFMVMVAAFLSLFVAGASVAAHQTSWLPTTLNLLGASLLFIFGVGSYGIEIIYLATERAEI